MHISTEIIEKYKSKSTSWLDGELWRLMSLWVRQKDSDYRGLVRCVTCGNIRNWRQVDAGHFISRRHKATKFYWQNVHPQCKRCNGSEGGGQPERMSRYIDRKFGPGTASHIEALSKQAVHWSRFDYIQLIEHYKQLLKKHKYELR